MHQWCEQPYIREEDLDTEICRLLSLYVIPNEWADIMLATLCTVKDASPQFMSIPESYRASLLLATWRYPWLPRTGSVRSFASVIHTFSLRRHRQGFGASLTRSHAAPQPCLFPAPTRRLREQEPVSQMTDPC
jgi:hypothetical protein